MKDVTLYDVKAPFTILYFWDYDCGHCKKATPILRDIYNKYKERGLQVYAVGTEPNVEPWKKYIIALASAGNIYCKLSGMVTEAEWTKWKPADFLPYLDVVLACFGPQRLLYGSDWPVCLVASTYQQQLAIVEDYINPLSLSEKQGIMGENAVQFYNL